MQLNNRRPVSDIVKAFEIAITGINRPGTSEAAFERVEVFDSEQLEEAFRYLLISEQRVAVVVPLDEEFEPVLNGFKLLVKRLVPVAVLITDRVFGDRKAALWGNETELGADALSELVLPAVTGLLLGHEPGKSGIVCVPASGSVGAIKDIQKNLPARAMKVLTFNCHGGVLETTTGRSPVL